ncbi:MAG: chemotaxis protein CheB [Planctomycetes bacterium]|nr:chemotaxis protein CheB [Planctomycetota bacterium]
MSAGEDRQCIAVAADDPADAAMLLEWLAAAGFAPVPFGSRGRCDAVLVRWPATVDLASVPVPMVVLHDPMAELPPAVVDRIEFVPWPDAQDVKQLLAWSSQLFTLLRKLLGVHTPRFRPCPAPSTATVGAVAVARVPVVVRPSDVRLVAVGVSTGGPVALRPFLQPFRGRAFPPVVVVQHIPPSFVQDLVQRLAAATGVVCRVAVHGEPLAAGTVWFAGGDRHLRVVDCAGTLHASCNDDPPRRGHRPAAEVLFESCACLAGTGVGVLMTGMGRDGAEGLLALRQRGWATFGQDEASCAIYGMPRAAKELGAIGRELPLGELGGAVVDAAAGAGIATRIAVKS